MLMFNADESLFVEGVIKSVCRKCNIILVDKSEEYCPKCEHGKDKERIVFFDLYPNLSAIDILYSLFELKSLADAKQNQIEKRVQGILEEELQKKYNISNIRNIIEELYEFGPVYEKIKVSISRQLKLVEASEIETAVKVFLTGDNLNRLNKSILILSATLIEILFKDFMVKVLTRKTDEIIANKLMEHLSTKSIIEQFNQLSIFMKSEIKPIFDKVSPDFYTKWDSMRKERNKIMHSNSIHISVIRTNSVFQLARDSVDVFARLNNNLVIHI